MLTKIKNVVAKYLFSGSILVTAVLYYLFRRRGRTIQKLKHEAAKEKLKNKTNNISKKIRKGKLSVKKGVKQYEDFIRLHRDYFRSRGFKSIQWRIGSRKAKK